MADLQVESELKMERGWFWFPFSGSFILRVIVFASVCCFTLWRGVSVSGFVTVSVLLMLELAVEEFVKLEYFQYRRKIELMEEL